VPEAAEFVPGAAVTADAPLRLSLGTSRRQDARYRPGEWVVLRLSASAPCYAAVYRVGASGEVKQALAPEEKPAGSYGLALKAGEFGVGEEWVIAVASVQPLSASEVLALLRAHPEACPDADALNAVLTHAGSGVDGEAPVAEPVEAWGAAVAVARYEVMDRSASAGPGAGASGRGDDADR
jgi:hypothetical protein